MSIQKSTLALDVNGKTENAYLAAPVNGGPGVLVLHAWWGLKPYFKQVCDRLAEQGFTALAPDLYQGHIANTVAEAKALLERYENESMGEAVKVAKDHLTSLNAGKPIGILGFSMGAYWALVTAANEPDVSAVVLFYGSGGVDFKQVKAKVLGHYAEVDEWEPLEDIKALENEMKAAGIDTMFHFYAGAGHWFVEADVPQYDSEAAALAWERTFAFLKKNL
jgi:carboxymethylenebutenolidase